MSEQTATKKERRVNGINVIELHDTIKAIRKEPGLGVSKFRLSNRWLGKAGNRSVVRNFYVAGEERQHKQTFVYDADEGEVLLGDDSAANPVEYLLHALAACVTTTTVYHAAARGITIQKIETTLEGDIDLRGFLGISDEVFTGYQEIRIDMKIKADASEEKIEELKTLHRFSPVFGTVTQPVKVDIKVEVK